MEINKILFQDVTVNALPPEVQEQREKNAIQHDPKLKELIGEEMPYTLTKSENGYIVTTELGVQFFVEVRYLPPENCGPARFELIFPDCIPF